MRTTIREFVKEKDIDIDVYGGVYDWAIAYCGTQLTPQGEEHYSSLLDVKVDIDLRHNEAYILTSDDMTDLELKRMFYDMAGYCSETDYERWFKE